MPTVLSTKKLLPNQRELLLNAGVSFVEYDAISIKSLPFEISKDIKNIVITSQNAARVFFEKTIGLDIVHKYFIVGQKTAALFSKKELKIEKTAQNSTELGRFIVENHKNDHFSYFCSKQRREELPAILKEGKVSLDEIITYETILNIESFNQQFDGVLFFSPSGIDAFAKANAFQQTNAFCIGETTADEARKYTDNIIVSNATTIESTIAKAVNYLKKKI